MHTASNNMFQGFQQGLPTWKKIDELFNALFKRFSKDEGWPLSVGEQAQVLNHLKVLQSKAVVLSV